MRLILSTLKHNPEKGEWNDTYRACLASLVDEDELEEYPHFTDKGATVVGAHHSAKVWVARYGLSLVEILYDGLTFEEMQTTWGNMNPNAFCILGGFSNKGIFKFVLLRGWDLAHDPDPDLGQISRPDKDGFSVQLLVPLRMMKFEEERKVIPLRSRGAH